ncbi:MAG: hypothetical protein ACRCXT_21205 [Paraclostridium sp.]
MNIIKQKLRKVNGGIAKELRDELNLVIGQEATFQLCELEDGEKIIVIRNTNPLITTRRKKRESK